MKKRKVFGLSLIVAGLLLFVLNPIANFTGFAIAENVSSTGGIWLYLLGLVMMIGGVLMISREDLEKRLGVDNTELIKKEIIDLVPGMKSPKASGVRKAIYREIGRVVEGDYANMNPHKVDPSALGLPKSQEVFTCDASEINDSQNLTGRGRYRHIIDRQTGKYLGLTRHVAGNRDYQWVYRVK
jgi:hypothetical protein